VPECRCGCGRPARKVWHSDECKEAHRRAQGDWERYSYAQERAAAIKRVKALPTHKVVATVHRMTKDDETELVQTVVTVPVPKLGIWNY
jgi:hypothetical protein